MNKIRFSMLLLSLLLATAVMAQNSPNVYNFSAKDIAGNDVSLSKYKGKVLLIVNVASKCGYTPQYADLQALYDEFAGSGLEILGFPANNFMAQEPGSDKEIHSFCTQKFGVTFPMFSKISVKGKDMHPLYKFLTHKSENGAVESSVKWNFQKFLVNKNGEVIASFSPGTTVKDQSVRKQIEELLK